MAVPLRVRARGTEERDIAWQILEISATRATCGLPPLSAPPSVPMIFLSTLALVDIYTIINIHEGKWFKIFKCEMNILLYNI